MFGKPKKQRSLKLSIEKDDVKAANTGDDKMPNPETVKLIAERGKDVARYVAITAVAAYAAIKTIDTMSQIAIKKTKSADDTEK